MKKRILILALLLVIVFASGCVEKELQQQVAPTGEPGQSAVEAGHIEEGGTQSTQGQPHTTVDDENVLSVINEYAGGKPTGPFLINMTLSNTPSLNKDVEVTITVGVLTDEFQNSTIGFSIYDRAKEHELPSYLMQPIFQKRWQNITISENETVTVKSIFRLSEQGHFTIGAGAGHKLGANFVTLFLNLTEKSARITDESYELPRPSSPPDRPYIIKLDIQGVPRLNNTVQLTATIASLIDKKNASFTVFLPEGFELVSGDLTWNGDLTASTSEKEIQALNLSADVLREKGLANAVLERIIIPPNKKVQIRATIKAVKTGDWTIFALPVKERPSVVECSYRDPIVIRNRTIAGRTSEIRSASTIGGCINIRVSNETAVVSELPLPKSPLPLPSTTAPVPETTTPSPVPSTYPPMTTFPPVPSVNTSK